MKKEVMHFSKAANKKISEILQLIKPYRKWLSLAPMLTCTTMALANKDFIVAPSGGDMTGAVLSQKLAAGDVTLSSSNGGNTGSGNIVINDIVSWSNNSVLTLQASNSVLITANITASGTKSGLDIKPKSGNGNEQPIQTGIFSLSQASISLAGGLRIAGEDYQVINSLGQAGDATLAPITPTLQSMAATVTANYALGSDINANATSTWNSGAGFAPVGASIKPFAGKFHGLGHTISNLTINRSGFSGVGLFGVTSPNATIQNVGILAATVKAAQNAGGLVGVNNGQISQSYASSTASAITSAGSLVGLNSSTASIKQSYASGSASVTLSSAGGLVGTNQGLIQNCYANGTATGAGIGKAVGGLVGSNEDATGAAKAIIESSYSTGAVTGASLIGGLLGNNPIATGRITNSYWNIQTSGQATSRGGTGLTTQAMMTQSSFAGFDFVNIWTIAAGKTYPTFSFQRSYIIYNINQLQAMRQDLAGNYALGADIDASATNSGSSPWGSAGFDPIGTAERPFTGSLAGQNYTISNLMINRPSSSNVGLFGYTGSTANINNVGMKNSQVTGQNNAGSLAGYNQGSIDASFSEKANVTATGSGANANGGLVGNNAGSISNSSSSGNITGISDVGGLAGLNQGTIKASNSWAQVSNATGAAGGLVGTNQQSGIIKASYSSSIVSVVNTSAQAGGLVGNNLGSISYSNALGRVDCNGNSTCGGLVAQNGSNTIRASITDSYATAGINGTGNILGGLVGYNTTGSTLTNVYASASTNSQTNTGGLVGSNEGNISNGYWNSSRNPSGISRGSTAGATGLSAAQMLVSANFRGFALSTQAAAQGWVVINTDGSLQSGSSTTSAATSPMLASEYSNTISNTHQLQLLQMNRAGSYRIVANIDAFPSTNSSDVWGTLGFVPIGNSSAPFTGSVDGQQYAINRLGINRTDNNVGLFGQTRNAQINNMRLKDTKVLGAHKVGALVGYFEGGSASNNYTAGYVAGAYAFQSADGDNIGGQIGYNSGSISNSHSTGTSYGGNYVGGLVGYNAGNISQSSSTANVNARAAITGANSGGLAGYNTGSINNSYASGNVISLKGYGGLVGTNSGGAISSSYANSSLLYSPSSKNIGGLVGLNQNVCVYSFWGYCFQYRDSSINNSYWNTTSSGMTSSAGGTGLNNAQMLQQSSFTGWDFTNTWLMNTYPVLRQAPAP